MMRIRKFEWDAGNLQKNEFKHGILKEEAESIFYDFNFSFYYNITHSTDREIRYNGYGKSNLGNILFTTFTLRNKKK